MLQQVLENLVVNQIQLQRAQREGIVIPDEMLNRALSDIARRNGTTLSELPALLAADGMDYAAYRKEMREQLTIERLRQRDVVSRIGVNPRERRLADQDQRGAGDQSTGMCAVRDVAVRKQEVEYFLADPDRQHDQGG